MGEKIEVTDLELLEIAQNIKDQKTTYQKEADRLGMDRTTLSKKVKALKQQAKGEKAMTDNKETIGSDINKEDENIPAGEACPTEDKEETDKVTFTISKSLIRALKLKAVYEDKKTIDVLRDALNSYIDPKYFKKLDM